MLIHPLNQQIEPVNHWGHFFNPTAVSNHGHYHDSEKCESFT